MGSVSRFKKCVIGNNNNIQGPTRHRPNLKYIRYCLLSTVHLYCLPSSVYCLFSNAYNSGQMFEPFQDRNPHFFGTVSLSWNVIKFIFKRIASIYFGPNHSGKKFRAEIWIFEKVIFFFSAEIWFFGLTWRVTLL